MYNVALYNVKKTLITILLKHQIRHCFICLLKTGSLAEKRYYFFILKGESSFFNVFCIAPTIKSATARILSCVLFQISRKKSNFLIVTLPQNYSRFFSKSTINDIPRLFLLVLCESKSTLVDVDDRPLVAKDALILN